MKYTNNGVHWILNIFKNTVSTQVEAEAGCCYTGILQHVCVQHRKNNAAFFNCTGPNKPKVSSNTAGTLNNEWSSTEFGSHFPHASI